MSGVGLMLGESCWGGWVWEKLQVNLEICPPPPASYWKNKNRGENGSLGKWDNQKTTDHWGATLENKKHSNSKNQKKTCATLKTKKGGMG